MTIDFLSDRIVFRFADYRTAGKLQKFSLPNVRLLSRVLRFSGQRVLAKVGKRKEVELFPKPSWLVRLLSPQVRRLTDLG